MHRISTRRCLSMLRDTSIGNELALPAINASYPPEVHTVWRYYGISSRTVPVSVSRTSTSLLDLVAALQVQATTTSGAIE